MNFNVKEGLSRLVCPQCSSPLCDGVGQLVCDKCLTSWPINDGIPVFGSSESVPEDEVLSGELRQLLYVAETNGWATALYEYAKARIGRGGTTTEDQRTADWIYLMPLTRETKVVVLGCGLGTVPIVLAKACGKVYAADSSWEKIAYLNVRKRQQGIENLFPVFVRGVSGLPFPGKCFDLVSVRQFQWGMKPTGFENVAQYVHRLLKDGGTAHFSLGNRLAYQRLLRREKKDPSFPLHTIFSYRRMLRAAGFSEIQFYSPLPHHNGIPLFYLPLENKPALDFFFRNIFPLFEMVTPEVKLRYGLEYAVAKVGVRICLFLKLTRFAKVFSPGFCIIAEKAGRNMEMGRAA
jgi:SAM-dependent methyltransferase/uncharacterized protein YbaR (Trm112 family)